VTPDRDRTPGRLGCNTSRRQYSDRSREGILKDLKSTYRDGSRAGSTKIKDPT